MATGVVVLTGAAGGVAVADPGRTTRGPSVGFVEGSPGTVEPGWTGPLVVAGFSTEDDFVYRLRVTGPDSYLVRERFVLGDGESMREEVRLDPVVAPGTYRAALTDERGPVETIRFEVEEEAAAAPLLRLDTPPPAAFLPRVRDGIRDVATAGFSLSSPATVVATVRAADGRVVRRTDLGRLAAGTPHRWAWDGRGVAGVVDRGDYRMHLTATAADLAVTVSSDVRVASYRVDVDRRVDRDGMSTSYRSPGGCRLAATQGRGLDVDCRDARRGAEVRYWFGSGAEAARWKVTGDGTAQRSAVRRGAGTAVTLRVPAGARWRTDVVAAAWRGRVLR